MVVLSEGAGDLLARPPAENVLLIPPKAGLRFQTAGRLDAYINLFKLDM